MAQLTRADEPVIAHQPTLLINRLAERRHRARGEPTHISVVTTASHKGQGMGCSRRKHRRDRGDIGQVGTPVKRVVADHGVASHQSRTLTAPNLLQ